MQVLLVEDDPFKEERLREALLAVRPNCEVVIGRTVQHAVALLAERRYDLVILDMALPSHESKPGGAPPVSLLSGGVEVLLELSYDARDDRVVIVTQYPDIEYDGGLYPLAKFPGALKGKLKVNLTAAIRFSMQDAAWRHIFEEAVR